MFRTVWGGEKAVRRSLVIRVLETDDVSFHVMARHTQDPGVSLSHFRIMLAPFGPLL